MSKGNELQVSGYATTPTSTTQDAPPYNLQPNVPMKLDITELNAIVATDFSWDVVPYSTKTTSPNQVSCLQSVFAWGWILCFL